MIVYLEGNAGPLGNSCLLSGSKWLPGGGILEMRRKGENPQVEANPPMGVTGSGSWPATTREITGQYVLIIRNVQVGKECTIKDLEELLCLR